MSETIFFNPGDSIGNFHDYNEAVRKGHLYKQKQRLDDELVVVNNKDKNEEYAIFYVRDRQPNQDKNNASYDVRRKIQSVEALGQSLKINQILALIAGLAIKAKILLTAGL